MERAFDRAVVEVALVQAGIGVGADVVGRVDLAIVIVEGDLAFPETDLDGLVFRDLLSLRDLMPSHRNLLPRARTYLAADRSPHRWHRQCEGQGGSPRKS